VFVLFEANPKFPVTALFPVAVKFNAGEPEPTSRVKLEEIFKVPVRLTPDGPRQFPLPALAPETVRFPVPALAVKELNPYQIESLDIETSKVIAPFVALVFKVRFPPCAVLRPKSPLIVMFPAVIVVSETNSIPSV
jgi:hypothetical protein